MPHVSDARASTHDRHDLMLVAALAAGDLAGTERDQAIALTTDCSECRALHDDLVAIARATSAVPAPIARPRDFQLTPQQAQSLRRTGWRRLVPAFDLSAVASRRLGVSLATFGLVGLLIGNVSITSFGMGGAAASAGPAYDTRGAAVPATTADQQSGASSGAALGPVAAASAAASAAPAAQPSEPAAASMAASVMASAATGGTTAGASEPTDVGITGEGTGAAAASGAPSAEAGGSTPETGPSPISAAATQATSLNPWNVVFVAAIAIGLLLLLLSRRRRAS